MQEEEAAMRKSDRRTGQEQSGQQLRMLLRELVREALFDMVVL